MTTPATPDGPTRATWPQSWNARSAARNARLRVRAAAFSAVKTLEDFDFGHQPVARTPIQALASGAYLPSTATSSCSGHRAPAKHTWPPPSASRPPGRVNRVLFGTATDWVTRLIEAHDRGRLAAELNAPARDLVVLSVPTGFMVSGEGGPEYPVRRHRRPMTAALWCWRTCQRVALRRHPRPAAVDRDGLLPADVVGQVSSYRRGMVHEPPPTRPPGGPPGGGPGRPAVSWPLVAGLGGLALLWPLAELTGMVDALGVSTAWLLVGGTVMVVWVGGVGLGRVPRPVLTLALAGVVYGLVIVALVLVLGLERIGVASTAVGVAVELIRSTVQGVVAGLLAGFVQRLGGP